VYTGMRLCPLARMARIVCWLRRASAGSMNTLSSGVMDLHSTTWHSTAHHTACQQQQTASCRTRSGMRTQHQMHGGDYICECRLHPLTPGDTAVLSPVQPFNLTTSTDPTLTCEPSCWSGPAPHI
jgi:hypothetical protein